MKKRIIFLVGETGSGKDTIAKYLEDFNTIVSYTTRPMRNTDVNAVNHYFVSEGEMDELLKNTKKDDVIAYTNKGGARYFASRSELKPGNNIYIINPDGIKWFKQHGPKDISYITFYIHLSLKERIERCKNRSDFKTKFYNRVAEESGDYCEFRLGDDYDFIINNRNSKRSAKIIKDIILKYEPAEYYDKDEDKINDEETMKNIISKYK